MESYHGYIRTQIDAILLFEASRMGFIPRIRRRLSERERLQIRSGSIYIWDEREAGMRRWTDGKSWSASRVSGSFLTYREMEGSRKALPHHAHSSSDDVASLGSNRKRKNSDPHAKRSSPGASPSPSDDGSDSHSGPGEEGYRYKQGGLFKQSFSITTSTQVKFHLIAYYTKENVASGKLVQPSTDPRFKDLRIPNEMYPDNATSGSNYVPAITTVPLSYSPAYQQNPHHAGGPGGPYPHYPPPHVMYGDDYAQHPAGQGRPGAPMHPHHHHHPHSAYQYPPYPNYYYPHMPPPHHQLGGYPPQGGPGGPHPHAYRYPYPMEHYGPGYATPPSQAPGSSRMGSPNSSSSNNTSPSMAYADSARGYAGMPPHAMSSRHHEEADDEHSRSDEEHHSDDSGASRRSSKSSSNKLPPLSQLTTSVPPRRSTSPQQHALSALSALSSAASQISGAAPSQPRSTEEADTKNTKSAAAQGSQGGSLPTPPPSTPGSLSAYSPKMGGVRSAAAYPTSQPKSVEASVSAEVSGDVAKKTAGSSSSSPSSPSPSVTASSPGATSSPKNSNSSGTATPAGSAAPGKFIQEDRRALGMLDRVFI